MDLRLTVSLHPRRRDRLINPGRFFRTIPYWRSPKAVVSLLASHYT